MTNRRDFLNLMGLGFAGMAGRSWLPAVAQSAGVNDADLVVFDPDTNFTVKGIELHHRHMATPYEGRVLAGRVETTYLRGRAVYRSSAFIGTARGQTLMAVHRSSTGAVS